MRKNISIAGLLFAWLCANGAVWNVVQAVAWSRMFADYARTLTVSAALRETFDPSKPCPLCAAVQKARATEQSQAPAQQSPTGADKIDLVCETSARTVFVAPAVEWPAASAGEPSAWRPAVPVPPPRV